MNKLSISTFLYAAVGVVLMLAVSFANETEKKVFIGGCENRIKDKKWKDYRIGFGVTNIIAQRLFDDGGFILVEEKKEMRERIENLRQSLWNKQDNKTVREIAAVDSSADLVIARLLYFGTPRTEVSVGPVHLNRNEMVVKVETEIVTPEGKKYIGSGQGSVARTALSTVFEYREDGVVFDQTATGEALKKALDMAIDEMVSAYKKEQK